MAKSFDDLPVKPSDAASLADALFQEPEGWRADSGVLERIIAKVNDVVLADLRPCPQSLSIDRRGGSGYFIAADAGAGGEPVPILLHFEFAASANGVVFPGSVVVGRVRPGGGREVVVTAAPFAASDEEQIRAFTEQVDSAFLPRPPRDDSAIGTGVRQPEISIPGVFEAGRAILEKTGWNPASLQLSASREMTTAAALAARDGEDPTAPGYTRVSVERLYGTAVWCAVRSGWREGYHLEADHILVRSGTEQQVAQSLDAAREVIRSARGYTKFTVDTSPHFDMRADHRSPRGWSDPDVLRLYEEALEPELRRWIEGEFARRFEAGGIEYLFPPHELRRLAVKLARSLLFAEALYDTIAEVKAERDFQFEFALNECETLTTGKELVFCLQWFKSRGRHLHLVAPNLAFKKRLPYPENMEQLVNYTRPKLWIDLAPRVAVQFNGNPLPELAARTAELARVAAQFGCTISVHSGSGKQTAVLEALARATEGRLVYKISSALQTHVFDVLAEQPADSNWRQLYDRMAARAVEFRTPSDPALAHIGVVAGSRDLHAPDGDHRFFADKLLDLPPQLLADVRRRHAAYLMGIADNLRS